MGNKEIVRRNLHCYVEKSQEKEGRNRICHKTCHSQETLYAALTDND